MFEAGLKQKFEKIFDFKKVTFDAPAGEAVEQETLFIEVESTNARIVDGRAICKVIGKAFIYSQNDKLPFGYFIKRIQAAKLDLTRELFFYDFEENLKVYQNLVRRSFGFVYFFNGQYDPAKGTITSIEFEG